MEGKVAKKNRITEGSIFGQLLLFFFPILFGTFFQQLYNTADAMVVGRFVGKQALAAVGGSTSTLINLLVGFFVGLSSGATVVISQFYGARKADKVHWAVHTSIAFSVIGGIIFMIVGLVGSPWALETMKTPEDVMGHAVVYIRIYFLGIIVNLVYNMGAGILRAVGDSRRPLYFLIASCFTNIILDVLLVAVLRMGVAGAALATITSQLLSAILVVRALMKTDDMYKLEWKKVRIDQRMLQRIVRIGIPAGMQSVMYNISNVIIQAGVNTLGTDNVTAWATYGKVDGLYWICITAAICWWNCSPRTGRSRPSAWICCISWSRPLLPILPLRYFPVPSEGWETRGCPSSSRASACARSGCCGLCLCCLITTLSSARPSAIR